jgi:hypothetical protein
MADDGTQAAEPVTTGRVRLPLDLTPDELSYRSAIFITASFVRWYEEPTLSVRYGTEYEEYRHNVPAWLPRQRLWRAR